MHMYRLPGEEKKEAKEETEGIDEEGSAAEEEVVEELEDLPAEIAHQLRGRSFESEEALLAALVELGVGDLPAVLIEGKPRLVMPSDQHNKFTSKYVVNFTKTKGKWGFCSGTHKIYISTGGSRYPDLSFWGYPRCKPSLEEPMEEGSIPDAVIQFSWQNKLLYEEDAIDDIMNKGLKEDHGTASTIHPVLGYLIKVRFSKKRALPGAIKGSKTQDMEGLDIYRLQHGTTVADARDPNNPNAEHWRYAQGGQEVCITITPQHLGITGFWALLCGDYRIKASDIFDDMQRYQQKRQMKGLAT
jgi:hypothetical protein